MLGSTTRDVLESVDMIIEVLGFAEGVREQER